MSEFTPGPWEWDAYGFLVTSNPDEGGRLCGIGVQDSARYPMGPPWNTKPADARLIAVVPKLYEAADELERMYTARLLREDDPSSALPLDEIERRELDAIVKLRGELRKARGET